jgi:hypothetical protein
MRLAIMQPYFFPYQGYFQLIAAVDRFVVYDDVAFIKSGWINRNRILTANGVAYMTVPLSGASSFRSIRDTACVSPQTWRDRLLRTLAEAYAHAPERDAGLALVRDALDQAESTSIADVARASLRVVCAYAEIRTELVASSTVYQNAHLQGTDRVLNICRQERAQQYINLPGGRALYHTAQFEAHGLRLEFLEPVLEPYSQMHSLPFVPGLSVVDAIMSLPRDELKQRLRAGHVGG